MCNDKNYILIQIQSNPPGCSSLKIITHDVIIPSITRTARTAGNDNPGDNRAPKLTVTRIPRRQTHIICLCLSATAAASPEKADKTPSVALLARDKTRQNKKTSSILGTGMDAVAVAPRRWEWEWECCVLHKHTRHICCRSVGKR